MSQIAYHAATKSLLINVVDPLHVRDLIPQSKLLKHDQFNMVVRHTSETTRVLKNLGIHAPMPAAIDYNWPGKYKPMAHQRAIVDFYLNNPRAFNLCPPGLGKTASSLWAADALMRKGVVRRCIVLAPLSTLERVWQQEIFDVLMHRRCVIVHGSADRRRAAMASDAHFYVINHDGIMHREVRDFIRQDPLDTMVIVDEGSLFRNGSSQRFRALEAATKQAKWLWWLTGTPCPNAPTDAWAQARIVSPQRVPQFMGRFRAQTMAQVSQYKWMPRNGSSDIVFNALQPAIRFEKKDCWDLPPMVIIDHVAQLTPEQVRHVKTMKNDAVLSKQRGGLITAVNAADKINKLRQILGGSIKDADDETLNAPDYVEIPHGPRTALTLELIEQAQGKAIVIAPFIGMMTALKRDIERAGYSVGLLNGRVSPGARNKIIREFKETADPHVLLCHPQVMAHGLNLTEADVLIFYAPIYSNDQYLQVIERINRAGQTRPMTVARIAAHPIEWEIYKMVDLRKKGQDDILSLYEMMTTM